MYEVRYGKRSQPSWAGGQRLFVPLLTVDWRCAERSADTFLRLQLSASSRPLTAVREVPASALPLPGPPLAVQLQIMFLD
jgi:hypothetical protein